MMKKQMYMPGILVILIMLLSVSCQQQPSSVDTQADLAEIKNAMQEVKEIIDESINEESIHVFINQADLALNELDNYIDEYMSVLDNANKKVAKEPRNQIINIKQKVAGIDFRLALLDDENLIGKNPHDQLFESDRVRPPAYPNPYPYRMVPVTEPAEIDETTIQDIEDYAKEIHQEIVNELKKLATEIDKFVVAAL